MSISLCSEIPVNKNDNHLRREGREHLLVRQRARGSRGLSKKPNLGFSGFNLIKYDAEFPNILLNALCLQPYSKCLILIIPLLLAKHSVKET
ncbi:hypothetical protein [Nostoc sp. ChiQUE02]|uniref:hypothetical protein n=1 Tax=Nostoc sp. ChiQUE02 TaxID=3075377 RepID=UPI002ADB56D3|nr:hypothetical protein [Nostoc sp. ChiQUE02]